jgi:hypothetical protein
VGLVLEMGIRPIRKIAENASVNSILYMRSTATNLAALGESYLIIHIILQESELQKYYHGQKHEQQKVIPLNS